MGNNITVHNGTNAAGKFLATIGNEGVVLGAGPLSAQCLQVYNDLTVTSFLVEVDPAKRRGVVISSRDERMRAGTVLVIPPPPMHSCTIG